MQLLVLKSTCLQALKCSDVHLFFLSQIQRKELKSYTSLQSPQLRMCEVCKFLQHLYCSAVPSLFSCLPCTFALSLDLLFFPSPIVLEKSLLLKTLSRTELSIFSLYLKDLHYICSPPFSLVTFTLLPVFIQEKSNSNHNILE